MVRGRAEGLGEKLDQKQISLEVTEGARSWLAEKGYDRTMGARPMARLIQEKVKKPLANEILFGALQHGGSVTVSLDSKGENIVFDYVKTGIPQQCIPN